MTIDALFILAVLTVILTLFFIVVFNIRQRVVAKYKTEETNLQLTGTRRESDYLRDELLSKLINQRLRA